MVMSFERAGAPPDGTMPVDALQNFEKTTIYPPDALDMFLTVLLLAVLAACGGGCQPCAMLAGVLPNHTAALLRGAGL
jgi:hypothetical protein